ncbi:MAG: DUF362 domain-containing protein [Coriobacteriia bacterium]|nr:DUF362 domain-containing protein [Coriobacteriia bacterium]
MSYTQGFQQSNTTFNDKPEMAGFRAQLQGAGLNGLNGLNGFNRRRFVHMVLVSWLGFVISELAACVGNDDNEGKESSPSTALSVDEGVTGNEAVDSKTDSPISEVFVVRDTDGTDDGVARLIGLMQQNQLSFYKQQGDGQGLIASDDVVIVKVNCQWAERGGTNNDLLRSLIEAIVDHPDGFTGEVVVADNGQAQYGTKGRGGSLDWSDTNAADKKLSALDVVNSFKQRAKVSASLWDEFTMQKVAEFSEGDTSNGFVVDSSPSPNGIVVSYPKFTSEYGTQISFREGIWDKEAARYDSNRLKVINLPVLKVHGMYQVTGAVKAYMGTTASRLTNQSSHNSVGSGGMGTQLAQTRMPAINIMDMVWVGLLRGPNTSYQDAVQNNMLAASTDPVALDWWCARNVLMPLALAKGVNTQRMDPDSLSPGTFGYWLNLTADELRAAGHSANHGTEVAVYE